MSQDPYKNNDLFPDWDFSVPDWLRDDSLSFIKETPVTEPEPLPKHSRPEPECPVADGQTKSPAAFSRAEAGTPRNHARTSSGSARKSASNPRPYRPSSARKRRRRGSRNGLITILILVLIGGMVFAGWQLGSIFLNYQRDRSAYDQLASSALISLAEPEDDRTVTSSAVAQTQDDPLLFVEEPEDVTLSEIPFSVDWDYLSSVNADIVGWLYCPDTIINYPVVQSESHDYYLNHGFEGQTNSSGTLFADRNSVTGITQSHLIIYGHNMKDNSMFGTLHNYTDRDYYEDHPVFYYLTPEDNYRVELICSMTVESVLSNFPTYFSSTSEHQNYLDRITSGAYWVNADPVSTKHQLMTFSTCTYGSGYNDARLLVHGVMIPIE